MEVKVLRKKLHEYIDDADELHLSAIYVLVENNIPPSNNEKYDEATLSMFYQRVDDDLNGLSASYTIEEVIAHARQAKK